MSTSNATTVIYEAFKSLPAEEKIRLVQELWDHIAEKNAEEVPLTEGHKRLLDERLEAHRRDPSAARPWEEVREELLARFGRR